MKATVFKYVIKTRTFLATLQRSRHLQDLRSVRNISSVIHITPVWFSRACDICMQFLLCFTNQETSQPSLLHSLQHWGLSTCAERVHHSPFVKTWPWIYVIWANRPHVLRKNERQNHSCLYRAWKQTSFNCYFWRRNPESKLSSATGKCKQFWILALNGPEKHCHLCCSSQTGLPKRNVAIYTRVRGQSDRGQVHKAEEGMY